MYLSRVRIRNFRSVKDAEIKLVNGKNVLVGRNSVGKSNIFAAIDIVMGEANPTYRNSKVEEGDFYYSHDKDTGEVFQSDEIIILCEMSKFKGEFIDHDSFDEKIHLMPFYGETVNNGRDRQKNLRKVRMSDISGISEIFDIVDNNFNKCWMSPREEKYKSILDSAERIVYVFRAKIEPNGEIKRDMRMFFSVPHENYYYMSFRAAIRSEIALSLVLPSFRDPDYQLRVNQYSWFGKLVKSISDNSAKNEDLTLAYLGVNDVANEIFGEFKDDFQRDIIDMVFPNSALQFQLGSDSRSELLKSLKIYVDDGFKSDISTKGSGFQSTFVINMFKKYADMKSEASAAVLCIEEPELFLHPHARRALSKQIDRFCESGHQAILTTHSTDFLADIDFDINIISCRKGKNGTKTKQVSLRDYKSLFVYNYQTEIFFADLVIICEGLEEYIIKEVAEYFYAGKMDALNVSVVSVQGKDQIPEFAKLLYSLGIPCVVFCDFDFILRDMSGDGKSHGGKSHKSLESLPEGFFRQYVDMSIGDKTLGRIRRFRALIKGNHSSFFHTAKSLGELVENSVVRESHYRDLEKQMNDVGIFILDGEIEGLFVGEEIIRNGKKFTNENLFELHRRIKDGAAIVEYVETNKIRNGIKKVFESFLH